MYEKYCHGQISGCRSNILARKIKAKKQMILDFPWPTTTSTSKDEKGEANVLAWPFHNPKTCSIEAEILLLDKENTQSRSSIDCGPIRPPILRSQLVFYGYPDERIFFLSHDRSIDLLKRLLWFYYLFPTSILEVGLASCLASLMKTSRMALVHITLAYRAHPFGIFVTHSIAFIDRSESHIQSKLHRQEGQPRNENND